MKTMKSLLTGLVAGALLVTATPSLADRDDHRGFRHKAWYGSQHFRDRGPHWRDSRRGHWRDGRGSRWHRDRGRVIRIYRHDRRDRDIGHLLGGALIGSAITHSFHEAYRDRGEWSGYREPPRAITGCYRIERLAGGRERRVELPLSYCR
jgi:hypothetical protein